MEPLKTLALSATFVLLLSACVSPPTDLLPSTGQTSPTAYPPNDFGAGAQPVASLPDLLGETGTVVTMAGFARFEAFSTILGQVFPPETTGDLGSRLEAKLDGLTTGPHSLGFLLDENVVSALGTAGAPRAESFRNHGAIVAVPGPPPSNGLSYVRIEGEVHDLFAFLGEAAPDAVRSMALVLARTVQSLAASTLTLEQLYADFDEILGDGAVVHVRTRGIAFGTTQARLEGVSNPVDAGLYEVVAAYHDAPDRLTAVRVGMGALWAGTGSEYLGVDVALDVFLVKEAALSDAARTRSAGLADEARSLIPLSLAGELQNPWAQDLEHHRIPGYLLAAHITPMPPRSPPGLPALFAAASGDPHEATEPVSLAPAAGAAGNLENRIVGAGLQELCGCPSPYDLGVYLLATFAWDGQSEAFTLYAVPVLYPVGGAAPAFTGERVRIEAVYSKYDVARAAVADAAHRRFDAAPWGPAVSAVLDHPERYGDAAEVRVLDGFLWANAISILPPTVSTAPVLLLTPQPTESAGDGVALSWFWPHDQNTVPDYHVYAHTNPAFVPNQRNEKAADLTQESYTVRDLSPGAWYFKVRAWSGAGFAPSNRVTATVGGDTPPASGEAVAPTLTRGNPAAASVPIEAGETIAFTAEARDADGDLDRTDFLLDGNLQGTDECYAACTFDDAFWSHTFNSPGTFFVAAQAFDLAERASARVEWTVTVSSPSSDPPPTPTVYSVTRCSDDPKHCLRVTWSQFTGPDFERYELYRKTGAGAWGLRWTVVNPADTTMVDEGLTCGTSYSYYVRLVTDGGSASSDSLAETPRGPAGYC